ncbi:MAG TPA: Lrp/AsnC family transcriptional regulator [bacterium]|nr:Lrp/AsnC family transcriptional regulator [bacterium]
MGFPQFTEQEKALIRLCQTDLPLCENPFEKIAQQLQVSEEWVIEKLRAWKQDGKLKKFRAILFHQKAGYQANGMSVWNVPEDKIEPIGVEIAGFDEVSHCYQRLQLPGFNFNLYAMIHGQSKQEVEDIVRNISKTIGVTDYQILYSLHEYKKTSMKYFVPEIESAEEKNSR